MGRKKNHPEHGKKKKINPRSQKDNFFGKLGEKITSEGGKKKKSPRTLRKKKEKKKKIASEPKFQTLPEI